MTIDRKTRRPVECTTATKIVEEEAIRFAERNSGNIEEALENASGPISIAMAEAYNSGALKITSPATLESTIQTHIKGFKQKVRAAHREIESQKRQGPSTREHRISDGGCVII